LRLTRVQAERRAAFRVVVAQAVITLGVAAVAAVGWGAAAASSALLGGGIGIAAATFMVLAVFRYPEGANAMRIAWGFYLGQFLKVALSVALLVMAFTSKGVVPLALLVAYAATFAGYWAAPRLPAPRR
jgi:ATP synthase protein I